MNQPTDPNRSMDNTMKAWRDCCSCWMDLQAFYYAFALPVGLVIVTNLVMFVVIMVNLARRPDGLRSNQSKHHTARTNLKAAVTIFVLLGKPRFSDAHRGQSLP